MKREEKDIDHYSFGVMETRWLELQRVLHIKPVVQEPKGMNDNNTQYKR